MCVFVREMQDRFLICAHFNFRSWLLFESNGFNMRYGIGQGVACCLLLSAHLEFVE